MKVRLQSSDSLFFLGGYFAFTVVFILISLLEISVFLWGVAHSVFWEHVRCFSIYWHFYI